MSEEDLQLKKKKDDEQLQFFRDMERNMLNRMNLIGSTASRNAAVKPPQDGVTPQMQVAPSVQSDNASMANDKFIIPAVTANTTTSISINQSVLSSTTVQTILSYNPPVSVSYAPGKTVKTFDELDGKELTFMSLFYCFIRYIFYYFYMC
jgi:hypothetical protein